MLSRLPPMSAADFVFDPSRERIERIPARPNASSLPPPGRFVGILAGTTANVLGMRRPNIPRVPLPPDIVWRIETRSKIQFTHNRKVFLLKYENTIPICLVEPTGSIVVSIDARDIGLLRPLVEEDAGYAGSAAVAEDNVVGIVNPNGSLALGIPPSKLNRFSMPASGKRSRKHRTNRNSRRRASFRNLL